MLVLAAGCGPSPEQAAETDRTVERLADQGGPIGALRSGFPDAYAGIRTKARAKRSATDADLKAMVFVEARDLALDHLDAFARAPRPLLREHARRQAALAEALRSADVEACAAFVMTGLPGKRGFPATAADLADETARLQLEAIAEGTAHPAPPPQFSDAAWRAWLAALARRGVDWDDLKALSSSPAKRAPAAERCRVGAALYATVPELPSDLSDQAARKLIAWSREGLPKAG